MKKEIKSSQNNSQSIVSAYSERIISKYNIRECPSCKMMTIVGMPGGRDSTCKNCGYKDPCCTD